MYINSNDLKVASRQLSSYIAGSDNAVKDVADFHSEDQAKLSFQEIQDMPRIALSKGYKIHPILAEILMYKPIFDVLATQDGDNMSISLMDLQKVQANPEQILKQIETLMADPLAYRKDDSKGLTSNFIKAVDVTEMATYDLADVTTMDFNGKKYLLALEKDLLVKGEARPILLFRNLESKSYKPIDLEQFGVVNTGFSGINLQETKDEYIVTIVANKYRNTKIEAAIDSSGRTIPNRYTFKIDGKNCAFTPPSPRIIVRDSVLDENATGLPLKMLVELRPKDLYPIQVSSFYYINRLHFSKEYFLGNSSANNVRSFNYLLESGRSSKRQSDAMKTTFGRKVSLNVEGVCVVGDRVYTMNSDEKDGVPTYFYFDLKASDKDMTNKSGKSRVDLNRIGDFGALSDHLGIKKILTFGMTEKDGYIYTLHGQVENYKDFFIVKVKESDLRSGKMDEVYKNMKIIPINLDGYTNRKIDPFGVFFSGKDIGIGIKDGRQRSAILYFDGKNL
ncbi:MAG: hypothetical protein WCH76_01620 [Candidatus Riflemargulisbacteria bacterium]